MHLRNKNRKLTVLLRYISSCYIVQNPLSRIFLKLKNVLIEDGSTLPITIREWGISFRVPLVQIIEI